MFKVIKSINIPRLNFETQMEKITILFTFKKHPFYKIYFIFPIGILKRIHYACNKLNGDSHSSKI